MILGGAPQAVLGREERGEAGAADVAQQRDGVSQARVDGGLVREQPEAPAAQEPQAMVDEDVEAGLNGRHRGRV